MCGDKKSSCQSVGGNPVINYRHDICKADWGWTWLVHILVDRQICRCSCSSSQVGKRHLSKEHQCHKVSILLMVIWRRGSFHLASWAPALGHHEAEELCKAEQTRLRHRGERLQDFLLHVQSVPALKPSMYSCHAIRKVSYIQSVMHRSKCPISA